MVKIRLRRTGAKKQPHYRVVVADSRSPRDGKFIEIIGHYNPRTEPPTVEIDAQRALYWLSVGAQPTEAVKRMLDRLGIMAHFAAFRRGEVALEAPVEEPEPVEAEEEEPAAEEELEEVEPIEGEAEEEEIEVAEEAEEWLEEEEEDFPTDEAELADEEMEETDEEAMDADEASDWDTEEDDDDVDDDDDLFDEDDE